MTDILIYITYTFNFKLKVAKSNLKVVKSYLNRKEWNKKYTV